MGYVDLDEHLAATIARLDDEAALLEAAGRESCVVCDGPHHEKGRDAHHEGMADAGMSSPAESRTGYDILSHLIADGGGTHLVMLTVDQALDLVGVMTRLTAHMQEQRTLAAYTNGTRPGIHMLTVTEAADGDTVVHAVQVVDGAGKPVAPGVEIVRDLEPTDKPDRSRLN